MHVLSLVLSGTEFECVRMSVYANHSHLEKHSIGRDFYLRAASTQALPGVGALACGGNRVVAGADRAAHLYAAPDASPAIHALSTPWDNHAVLLKDAMT